MLRRLVESQIRSAESDLGESLDYLREIADASTSAFLKFGMFTPLASHRSHASPEVLAVARLTATRHEDCGTCLQISVNQARSDGVDPGVIRHTVEGHPDRLPDPLAAVYRFTEAVVTRSDDVPARVDEIRERLGREVLVEVALAVATARVYPTVKRALGRAVSCRLVDLHVDGEGVAAPAPRSAEAARGAD